MKKYSKQRELILNSLQSRSDHPTAETLYMDLKKEMPQIGIATVYRNLAGLCEDNSVLKITGTDKDRFDGNIQKHYHFICDNCKEIYDMFLQKKEMIVLEEMLKNISGNSEDNKITVNGICKKCKGGN